MKKHLSWIIVIIAVAVIVAGIVWYASRPGKHDVLAQCIADSGATFYGAFWCSHCQSQKAVFGKSARLLPYTECSTVDGRGQLPVCNDEKIETYPTWEFKDGSRKTGTLSMSELSGLTGCALTSN